MHVAFVVAAALGAGNAPASEAARDPNVATGNEPTAERLLRRGNAFHDTHLDMPCVAALATDGNVRCLPTTLGYKQYYVDRQCAVMGALVDLGIAKPPKYIRSENLAAPSEPSTFSVYLLGSRAVGPIYTRQGTACIRGRTLHPEVLHHLDALVQPETFHALADGSKP